MNNELRVDYSSTPSSYAPSSHQAQQLEPCSSLYSGSTVVQLEHANTTTTTNVDKKTKGKRALKYRPTKRPSSERRFQCDLCESRFFTQKDVKRHMIVHTGLRNFACPFCTHRFGRKDHLVRHTKKSHNQDTRTGKQRQGKSGGGGGTSDQSTAEPQNGSGKKKRTRRNKKQQQQASPIGENSGPSVSDLYCPPSSVYAPSGPAHDVLLTASAHPPEMSYLLGSSTNHQPSPSCLSQSLATSSYECLPNSVIMLSASPTTSMPKLSYADNVRDTRLLGATSISSSSSSLSLPASFPSRHYVSPLDSYASPVSSFNCFTHPPPSSHHFLSTSGGPSTAQPSLFPASCYGPAFGETSYKLGNGSGLYPSPDLPPSSQPSESLLFAQPSSSSCSSLNPLSIKTISSSIVHGVNTCIELDRVDYNFGEPGNGTSSTFASGSSYPRFLSPP